MTRLLVIRHGQTSMVGRRLAGRMADVHLDERGQTQARGLVERLDGLTVDAVFTSPLERSRETAQPLARHRGLEVQELSLLQELDYGDWQGASFADLAEERYWEAYNQCRSLCRIPGGEMLMEAQLRMVLAMERLSAEHPAATLALVGHSDPIKALLLHVLGMPLDHVNRLDVLPASISVLDIPDGHPIVRCINDLGELHCLRGEH